MQEIETQVLIIGCGPSGMSAALTLYSLGIKDITIIERDILGGGLPRFCSHTGFGIRDLHWVYKGPKYAKSYLRKLENTSIRLLTETTAIEWIGPKTIKTTSPNGINAISAEAILLATGCRERPRSARLIPGYRPFGIFNTGSLQDLINIYKKTPGKKAVIEGAELVSLSAIHTLKSIGCKPLLLTTEYEAPQVYGFYKLYEILSVGLIKRIPILTNTKITNILGKERVEAVEIEDLKNKEKRIIECDTLVLTGKWIPDNEFARMGQIEIDEGTNGPKVDFSFRTSKEGVFAAGNILRGAEPSDYCALEGRSAGYSIFKYLKEKEWPLQRIKIDKDDNLEWVFPSYITTSDGIPKGRRILFRVKKFIKNGKVNVFRSGSLVYTQKYVKLGPNFSWNLEPNWIGQIDGDKTIKITIN